MRSFAHADHLCRSAPAVWNMASSAGKRVATLGLWATYPAEAVSGTIVSDRLFTFLFKEEAPPAGVVYPADRDRWARDALQRARQDMDEAALRQYLPWLTHDDFQRHAESDDFGYRADVHLFRNFRQLFKNT